MKISKKDEPVNREILEQFEDQKSRGTQGFGALFIDKKGKATIKRATGEILSIIDLYMTPANTILFHHRAPSSSRNKISQTHPIHISAGSLKFDYYFMHNGVISNSDERKKIQEDLGFNYSTQVQTKDYYDRMETIYNDSESLGIDIARFIEGQTEHIRSTGSAAFLMAQINKETAIVEKIFFGRNEGNPLNMFKNKEEIMISSEGKGSEIKQDILYSFDPKTNAMKLRSKKMIIPRFEQAKIKTEYGVPYRREQFTQETKITGFDGYNMDTQLERDLEDICEDYSDEATDILKEFFETIQKTDDNAMFKVDVSEYLKKIAQNMIASQEECHQRWSAEIVKDLDTELKTKIEKETETEREGETKTKIDILDKFNAK